MNHAKQVRKKLELTQAEMARACNTHIVTISKWETGTRSPSGPAERLLDLLAEIDGTVWMQWFRKRFIDQPGKPGHSN